MKTEEWHQQGCFGEFIVKLKKNPAVLLFYVWISEFGMDGSFLKACFLNR